MATIAPNGQPYPWGKIVAIHRLGEYEIVEATDRDGRLHFHPYINGEDLSRSSSTLERSIVDAIAVRFDGCNTRASDYFFRIVGREPHRDYAAKAAA